MGGLFSKQMPEEHFCRHKLTVDQAGYKLNLWLCSPFSTSGPFCLGSSVACCLKGHCLSLAVFN